MTEKPIFELKINQPNWYEIDVEKFSKATMSDLAHLLSPMRVAENYEFFEVVKPFLKIPEKPKTLEELSQELDKKFDDLLIKTKRKFSVSQQSAEYHYNQKFKKITDNFEHMKKWGHLPRITLVPNGSNYLVANSAGSLTWGTEFNLNPSKNSVGYYYVEPNLKINMTKTPNIIVRFFMDKLLGFKWVNAK